MLTRTSSPSTPPHGINGRKIDWVVKDSAFDPQQTVQVARRLVDQDGVVAIVAANGTAQSQATFPFVLDQRKVPVLNPLGGDATWYQPARDGLFGLQTLYEDQAAALGDWVARDGAKKVLVVHSDPAAFVNVAKEIGPAAHKVDPSVRVKQLKVKFQTSDYSPVISKVKAEKPDAVVMILASAEAASYLKEAKLQGLSTPVYGYAPVAAQSTLTLAGKAAEGVRAVQLVKSPNDDDPAVEEFRAAMAKYEKGQLGRLHHLVGLGSRQGFRGDRQDDRWSGHLQGPDRRVRQSQSGRHRGRTGPELLHGQPPRHPRRTEGRRQERALGVAGRLLHPADPRLTSVRGPQRSRQ